jgi:hypothetical protein
MPTSRRHELAAAVGGVMLLVIIAVFSAWAHHRLSAAGSASIARSLPTTSTTAGRLSPESRQQLRVWLKDAKPPIDALLIEGDIVVTAAAHGDGVRAASACHTAADAVASAEQHLPSPDAALNTSLQQAFTDYQTGIQRCVSATQKQDAIEFGQAAGFISRGKTELHKAYDVIAADLSADHVVLPA